MPTLGRHGPKTRTACLTCKKRRVKCDEARPACKRCIKAGRICGGYQLELISSTPAQVPSSTVLNTSATLLSAFSATQQEWQAYGLYSGKVSSALGGAFDTDLWRNLFLQIASSETTVRSALFALGTLARHDEPESSQHISECLCLHCRQALRYYNRAITSLSDYLKKTPPNESTNIALATCALFICIELYRTNDRNAMALVENGGSILAQSAEMSSCPTQLQPELVNLFNRLQIATGMFTIDFPRITNTISSLALEQQYFENLSVARDMLQKLTPKAQGLRRAAFQFHSADASVTEKAATLDGLVRKQHMAQTELASWFQGFGRLRSLHSGSFAERLLFAKFVSTKIHVDTALAISQDIYAQHIDDFKSIVSAAEEGIRHASDAQKSLGFAFESGFLASLYLAGLRCRDPHLRRKLLELMHQTNAKEGLWCRSEAICVVTRVMNIEEGRSSIPPQGGALLDPSPIPPLFYEVSCEVNYRKSGSLFVDVTYVLYDEGSLAPWKTFKETLLIEG